MNSTPTVAEKVTTRTETELVVLTLALVSVLVLAPVSVPVLVLVLALVSVPVLALVSVTVTTVTNKSTDDTQKAMAELRYAGEHYYCKEATGDLTALYRSPEDLTTEEILVWLSRDAVLDRLQKIRVGQVP